MTRYTVLALLICAGSLHHSDTNADILGDTLDPFVSTDGIVYTVAEANNVLYLGGSFNLVGRNTGGGAFVFPGSGGLISNQLMFNGTVSTAVPDGQGGCYVGGSFTRVGHHLRTNLVHFLNDGSVNPHWRPNVQGNYVRAIARFGNSIFIGGSFTNVNGLARTNLAAIEAGTGHLSSWNPGANGFVNSLQVHGTNLYVGGDFTHVGGLNRSYLAAVSLETGLATSWNPQPDYRVHALHVFGNRLFVGGYFSFIGQQSRSLLASFALPNGTLETWNPNVGSGSTAIVYALAATPETLFVGGSFNVVGSSNRLHVAAVDLVTGLAKNWNAQLDNISGGQVNALHIAGSDVYVGGGFTQAGGVKRYYAAALNLNTAAVTG
ncbi:MAG: hypothetical protein ACK4UN_16645, partial [Limisphaerales bacterium]